MKYWYRSRHCFCGKSWLTLACGLVIGTTILPIESAEGQAAPPKPKYEALPADLGKIDPSEDLPLVKAYRDSLNDFRKALKGTREEMVWHHTKFYQNRDFDRLREWGDRTQEAHVAKTKMLRAAGSLFKSDPAKYGSLGELLFEWMKRECEGDRYDGMADVAKDLFDAGYSHPELPRIASQAAFAENRYDEAISYLRRITASADPEVEKASIGYLEATKAKWEKEMEVRAREAQANDLPRVELLTTKGTMVLELFENEAPETVANFIYLVEKGFYDGKSFFRVLEHFVAQTGCERSDGSGSTGYTIKGEMRSPGARGHFRGSIGVALGADRKTGAIDTESGSGQFYFCFLPQTQMDGEYCVFGYVYEGLDRLGDLRKVDLSGKDEKKKESEPPPDIIVKAKVLRKRDHVYKPTPVSGKVDF